MDNDLRQLLHHKTSPEQRAQTQPSKHSHSEQGTTSNEQPNTPDNATPNDLNDEQNEDGGVNSRKRSNPSSRIAYPRKRAIRACQKCRIRRTKCDNVRPACGACLDLGAECVYAEGDPSTFDAASLAILEKLNTIESLLQNPTANTSTFRAPSATSPVSPAPQIQHGPVAQTPASIHSTSSAVPPTESTILIHPRLSVETIIAWSVFAPQRPAYDLKPLLADQTTLRTSFDETRPTLPDQSVGHDLYDRFMNSVYIFNPVLEETELQQYIRDLNHTSVRWDAVSCLVLLVYAHGCLTFSDHPRSQSESSDFRRTRDFQNAEAYFEAALKRMGVLFYDCTLIQAQCFFLAGVYLMATLRPLAAWKMFAQALTCCQTFVPDAKDTNLSIDRQLELYKSIYWACFKSELELRIELNVYENSTWDLAYPEFYPLPREEIRTHKQAIWFYYLGEIALRRLSNRILNHTYKDRSNHFDLGQTADFEKQASDWLAKLPPMLKFNGTVYAPGGELTDSLKFILDGHLIDVYEMIYWPYIAEVIQNGYSTTGAAARSVEFFAHKFLDLCVSRIRKNEQGFYHRHHGTWLMLRSCTRSGLMLIAARHDCNLIKLLPVEWEFAVWKVIGLLRFWKRESRDIEDRLRVMEGMMRSFKSRQYTAEPSATTTS